MRFFFLAGLLGLVVGADVESQFQEFAQKFNKIYTTEEYVTRLAIFAKNLDMVDDLNKAHMAIGGEAVFGITKFMDLTPEDFKKTYLTASENNHTQERIVPDVDVFAASVDWRTKHVVTPVKDQGQCGSCWAFSAIEAIESYAKLNASYDLLHLSAQQVTSCDKVDGGCNGGNTETAYKYIVKAGGLEDDTDYPYTSGGGRSGICKFKKDDVKVKITGYTAVKKGEDNLKKAVNMGPASVCVAAGAFQTYNRGILKLCPGAIDHCVQAVGYDDTAATPYWIVRNSWAADWGEKGYIRLEQGKDICKIANDVTYPTF